MNCLITFSFYCFKSRNHIFRHFVKESIRIS